MVRGKALVLFALTVAIGASGCATKRPQMLPSPPVALEMPSPPAPAPPPVPATEATGAALIETGAWLVPVAFATDRGSGRIVATRATFTGRRGALVYGDATVSIPRTHEPGEIELPHWYKFQFHADPAKHFVITAAAPVSIEAWSARLRQRLEGSTRKAIFLFVHGYNVGFDDALRRTAQIEHDTAFPGPALLFSWPSTGTMTGYAVDGDNAAWAVPDLVDVLDRALTSTGADEVFIVAHSMGNRVLVTALAEIGRTRPELRGKIKKVILAAPDIDADTFKRDIAPRLTGIGTRVTIYASSRDLALAASGGLHGYGRLGDTRPSVTTAPPIETVDASALPADLLGHSYIGADTSVLGDVRRIFQTHAPPAARGLLPAGSDDARYWRFAVP